MAEKKSGIGRLIFCLVLMAVIFLLFIARLFQWQILEGEEFAEISRNSSTSFIKLEATRGEIVDRNGVVLAGNVMGYSVKLNRLLMDNENPNSTILKVINLLELRGEEWKDRLPILIDESGAYYFNEGEEEEIAYLKSDEMLGLQEYATAEHCMSALIKRYDATGYSTKDTRDLLSVRYSMHRAGFGRTTPYTIADNLSAETIGILNEMESGMSGIETGISHTRYYGEDGTIAPHTVGTAGAITAEQYEAEKENDNLYSSENVSGYTMTDTHGRGGIEEAYEEALRGESGKQTIITDTDGRIVNMNTTLVPEAGNTVVLTMDSEIQKITNASLEKNVIENTESEDAKVGSAVMLDVRDFGVLASANYPSYDLNRYVEDDEYLQSLSEDENNPLFNYALSGTYPPGSSFKPLVAIASLKENILSTDETVYCDGVYHYYESVDFMPTCLDHHGTVNMYSAVTHSCNIYFYDAGRRLGINRMAPYAEYFGLGTYTGVELPEQRGRMSNPREYEEIRGEPWVEGNTVTAAIGQLDDSFTTIQLATYAATIANGGKRLRTHFMKEIRDYDQENLVEAYQPTEMMDADIDPWIIDYLKDAMHNVAQNGTGRHVFQDYEIDICAKTGTAESGIPNKPDHLTFIAFAPRENPEVAVAVIMEYGQKSGLYAMNVAKDMLDAYFKIERDEDGNKIDSAASEEGSPSPSPSPSAKPHANGPDADIGAFYDPDKDAPTPAPSDESETSSEDGDDVG